MEAMSELPRPGSPQSVSRWRLWIAALAGVAGGALYAFLLSLCRGHGWPLVDVVSEAGLYATPTAAGVVCVGLSSPSQQARIAYRLTAPWLSILIVFVVLLALQWEVAICLIMLSPAVMFASSCGGALAGFIATRLRGRRLQRGVLGCFAVLPLLLAQLESGLVARTEWHTVENHVVINASPDVVWQTLLNVPNIRHEELRWSFSHAIGLPRPRAALLSGSGVGSVRDLYWDDDIHFREYVTTWAPQQRLAYDVDVSPARDALRRLDTHVVIGDRHFNVIRGEYRLHALAADRTELVLGTTYRISTTVNGYGNLWAHSTLDDFHTVVLDLLKQRAETSSGLAAR